MRMYHITDRDFEEFYALMEKIETENRLKHGHKVSTSPCLACDTLSTYRYYLIGWRNRMMGGDTYFRGPDPPRDAQQQIDHLTGTLQAERTLREQTEAEMRAELETERGARLDAEEQYRQGLISSAHWQHLSEAAEAENMRLRDALEACRLQLLQSGADITHEYVQEALDMARAALSPAEGKGGL